MNIGHNLPALIGAELRGIRGHLAGTERDDMENPSRRKLNHTIRHVRRWWWNLPGYGPIAVTLFAVAYQAICLVEGFAFLQRARSCAIWVVQFASGARRFFFSGAKMKRLVVSGDGTGHRSLQCESISRNRIGSECLVG